MNSLDPPVVEPLFIGGMVDCMCAKVEDSWKTLEFLVLPFKDFNDVFILGNTDDVQVASVILALNVYSSCSSLLQLYGKTF